MNTAKNKGSQYERDVVGFFQGRGHETVERAYGAGRVDDRGDLVNVPEFCLELKNHAKQTLSVWMDELEVETKNKQSKYGAVVHKRARKPVEQSYVTMTLDTFERLVYAVTSHPDADAIWDRAIVALEYARNR